MTSPELPPLTSRQTLLRQITELPRHLRKTSRPKEQTVQQLYEASPELKGNLRNVIQASKTHQGNAPSPKTDLQAPHHLLDERSSHTTQAVAQCDQATTDTDRSTPNKAGSDVRSSMSQQVSDKSGAVESSEGADTKSDVPQSGLSVVSPVRPSRASGDAALSLPHSETSPFKRVAIREKSLERPLAVIEATTAAAKQFQPIQLNTTGASASIPPQSETEKKETKLRDHKDREKDRHIAKKLKEMKKGLVKHRPPQGMAVDLENDVARELGLDSSHVASSATEKSSAEASGSVATSTSQPSTASSQPSAVSTNPSVETPSAPNVPPPTVQPTVAPLTVAGLPAAVAPQTLATSVGGVATNLPAGTPLAGIQFQLQVDPNTGVFQLIPVHVPGGELPVTSLPAQITSSSADADDRSMSSESSSGNRTKKSRSSGDKKSSSSSSSSSSRRREKEGEGGSSSRSVRDKDSSSAHRESKSREKSGEEKTRSSKHKERGEVKSRPRTSHERTAPESDVRASDLYDKPRHRRPKSVDNLLDDDSHAEQLSETNRRSSTSDATEAKERTKSKERRGVRTKSKERVTNDRRESREHKSDKESREHRTETREERTERRRRRAAHSPGIRTKSSDNSGFSVVEIPADMIESGESATYADNKPISVDELKKKLQSRRSFESAEDSPVNRKLADAAKSSENSPRSSRKLTDVTASPRSSRKLTDVTSSPRSNRKLTEASASPRLSRKSTETSSGSPRVSRSSRGDAERVREGGDVTSGSPRASTRLRGEKGEAEDFPPTPPRRSKEKRPEKSEKPKTPDMRRANRTLTEAAPPPSDHVRKTPVGSRKMRPDLDLPVAASSPRLSREGSPPSPSTSKDSGVSGLAPGGPLIERLLTSDNSGLARVVRLVRKEFGFDGFMENGEEDLQLSEYIVSLRGLKWGTFRNAVAEKYPDFYWSTDLLAQLYEAVNDTPPHMDGTEMTENRTKQATQVPNHEVITPADDLEMAGKSHSVASADLSSNLTPASARVVGETGFDVAEKQLLVVTPEVRVHESPDASVASSVEASKVTSADDSKDTQGPELSVASSAKTSRSSSIRSNVAASSDVNTAPNVEAEHAEKPDTIPTRVEETSVTSELRSAAVQEPVENGILPGSRDSDTARENADDVEPEVPRGDSVTAHSSSRVSLSSEAASEPTYDPLSPVGRLLKSASSQRPESRSSVNSSQSRISDEANDSYRSLVGSPVREGGDFTADVIYFHLDSKWIDKTVKAFVEEMSRVDLGVLRSRLGELDQERRVEQKERQQLNKVYAAYAETRRKGDKKRGGEHNVLQKVEKEITDRNCRLLTLKAKVQIIQLRLVERWGLDNSLLASLAGAPANVRLQLAPRDPAPIIRFPQVPTDGPLLPTAASVEGLFSFLYSKDAFMNGYVCEFFYCFRYFTSAHTVYSFIEDKLSSALMTPGDDPIRESVLQRSLDLLACWLHDFAMIDFRGSAEVLLDRASEFVQNKLAPAHESMAASVHHVLQDARTDHDFRRHVVSSYIDLSLAVETSRYHPSVPGTPGVRRKDQVALFAQLPSIDAFSVLDHEPSVLAEQLTLMAQTAFQKVHPVHFLNSRAVGVRENMFSQSLSRHASQHSLCLMGPMGYRLFNDNAGTSSLFHDGLVIGDLVMNLLDHVQSVAHWVAAEIVSCHAHKTQTAILARMIQVARLCLDMNDFMTSHAMLDGLEHILVHNLPATRNVPSKVAASKRKLIEAREKVRSDDDFVLRAFRDHPNKGCLPAPLPFLLHLQQREIKGFTHADGSVKWNKMRTLTEFVDRIRVYQSRPYNFPGVAMAQETLRRRIAFVCEQDVGSLAQREEYGKKSAGLSGALKKMKGRK